VKSQAKCANRERKKNLGLLVYGRAMRSRTTQHGDMENKEGGRRRHKVHERHASEERESGKDQSAYCEIASSRRDKIRAEKVWFQDMSAGVEHPDTPNNNAKKNKAKDRGQHQRRMRHICSNQSGEPSRPREGTRRGGSDSERIEQTLERAEGDNHRKTH